MIIARPVHVLGQLVHDKVAEHPLRLLWRHVPQLLRIVVHLRGILVGHRVLLLQFEQGVHIL